MIRRIPLLFLAIAAACSERADPAPTAGAEASLTALELADRRGAALDPSRALHTIAFGSCNRVDLPQPLWNPILAAAPDLWIWLGDNVYGDTEDMSVMRAKYERQLGQEGYRALRAATPIVGTWDDHDFGANNAGSEYPQREASQREALDFLGEPADSPRRRQAGVYTSYVIGEPPQRTKIILLDARYHRGAPGTDGPVLGEQQWAWLEAELSGSDAQLHLIGGGYQFLPVDHTHERWANFPSERTRLFDVIARSGAPGVILLSGDRHISEIMRIEDAPLTYPLYEVTSSGLTHSWLDNPGEVNRYRVGELYTDLGFGVVEVDWEGDAVKLELRDRAGSVAQQQTVSLSGLLPITPKP